MFRTPLLRPEGSIRPVLLGCAVLAMSWPVSIAHGQGEIRKLTHVTPPILGGFGQQVASAGDIDADGFDDVAIADDAKTRIYSGLDGSVLREYPKGRLVDVGDVDLDGASDLVVAGASSLTAYSGTTGASIWSVAGTTVELRHAGDFDLDGRIDVLSRDFNTITIRSGQNGATLKSFAIAVSGLAGGRDIDADGTLDFIVSRTAPTPDVVEVISGATGAVLWSIPSTSANDPPQGLLIGDVDDDLRPDFVVSEPTYLGGLGRVRAFSGVNGALIWQTTGNVNSGRFGHTLLEFPDVNTDGRPDVLAAADFDATPGSDVSSVTALSGRTGATIFKTFSTDAFDDYGRSMAVAGDVNGDEMPDLIVGEPAGSWQAFNTGVAYLYSTHCWEQYADLPGCSGTGGIKPTLGIGGCIAPLCTASIEVAGCYGNSPGFLLISGSTPSFVVSSSCSLILSPASSLIVPFVTSGPAIPGGGVLSIAAPMPVGLPANAVFEMQALIADPGVPLGFAVSNGLWIDKF